MRCPTLLLTLLSSVLASSIAVAEPSCLPKEVFDTSVPIPPSLYLGFVNDVPTVCAQTENNAGRQLGCWTVDAKTGALSATSASGLPGQGRWVPLDAKSCVEGYCTGAEKIVDYDAPALLATSTDEKHAVVVWDNSMYVFDTGTKTMTQKMPLSDPNEDPDRDTSVGNMPVRVLYIGDTIYIVGTDAGPFMAVTVFRQDGGRLGRFYGDPVAERTSLNVFGGTVNQIDERHIALADTATRTMTILDVTNGARKVLKRSVAAGPCSKKQMEDLFLASGDVDRLPAACKRYVKANHTPYFGIVPIRLPSGDFLTLLGGEAFGTMAILDGRRLTEKRRVALRRCK